MVPWSWSFLGLVIFFYYYLHLVFIQCISSTLYHWHFLGVWWLMRVCERMSCLWCLSCFVMFVASYSCVDFFFFFLFETDHAVHGLPQITLCVYSRGRVGFLGWGGFFCCFGKKIWVCCHVQAYVQLYDALIFISMPAWLYFLFWFILGLTTFGYSVMTVFIFWLFLLGLVHSLPPFLHNFAWSWLLLPLSQW